MSSLRPPGLGPLVGHTTHESCRLWIRAGDPADAGAHLASDRRTLGVIGLLNTRGRIEKAYYFRLPVSSTAQASSGLGATSRSVDTPPTESREISKIHPIYSNRIHHTRYDSAP